MMLSNCVFQGNLYRKCYILIKGLNKVVPVISKFNPLNAELNPICHLLALLGAHRILHISSIRVKPNLMQFDIADIHPAPLFIRKLHVNL